MAAVILLQSSPKQTPKQPRPPVLSRLQLWKMPLQRESVGEYLWGPTSEFSLRFSDTPSTALFIKYLLLGPSYPREVIYLCYCHCCREEYFFTVRRMMMHSDSSCRCSCCAAGPMASLPGNRPARAGRSPLLRTSSRSWPFGWVPQPALPGPGTQLSFLHL